MFAQICSSYSSFRCNVSIRFFFEVIDALDIHGMIAYKTIFLLKQTTFWVKWYTKTIIIITQFDIFNFLQLNNIIPFIIDTFQTF